MYRTQKTPLGMMIIGTSRAFYFPHEKENLARMQQAFKAPIENREAQEISEIYRGVHYGLIVICGTLTLASAFMAGAVLPTLWLSASAGIVCLLSALCLVRLIHATHEITLADWQEWRTSRKLRFCEAKNDFLGAIKLLEQGSSRPFP